MEAFLSEFYGIFFRTNRPVRMNGPISKGVSSAVAKAVLPPAILKSGEGAGDEVDRCRKKVTSVFVDCRSSSLLLVVMDV